MIRWGAIGATVLLVAFVWSLTGNDKDNAPTEVEALDASIGAEALGLEGCPAVDGSSYRPTQFETPPTICIDTGPLNSAEFATTFADFTIILAPTLH